MIKKPLNSNADSSKRDRKRPSLFGGETGAHIGVIDKGNFADLVVLKSNPVNDIAHASDIDSVIKNGILYSATETLGQ